MNVFGNRADSSIERIKDYCEWMQNIGKCSSCPANRQCVETRQSIDAFASSINGFTSLVNKPRSEFMTHLERVEIYCDAQMSCATCGISIVCEALHKRFPEVDV